MARQKRSEPAVVNGLRLLQAAKFRRMLNKLPLEDSHSDYVHPDAVLMARGRRRYLEERLARLEAGEDVGLQGWELADELRQHFPRSGCYDIVGDELIVNDYRDYSNG